MQFKHSLLGQGALQSAHQLSGTKKIIDDLDDKKVNGPEPFLEYIKDNNLFSKYEEWDFAAVSYKLKCEKKEFKKRKEEIAADTSGKKHPKPDRTLWYWMRKAAGCDHSTREMLVLEVAKLKKHKNLVEERTRDPVEFNFTYQEYSPYMEDVTPPDEDDVKSKDGDKENENDPIITSEGADANGKTADTEGAGGNGENNADEKTGMTSTTAIAVNNKTSTENNIENPTSPSKVAVASPKKQKQRIYEISKKNWISLCTDYETMAFCTAAKKGTAPTVMELKMKLVMRPECEKDITRYRELERGWTPLHFCAMTGNEEVVKALKEMANCQDNKGMTPLHIAAWHGNRIVCDKLVECGADIDIQDHAGKKCVAYARENHFHSTVLTLIRFGVDEQPKPRGGKKKKKKTEAERKADREVWEQEQKARQEAEAETKALLQAGMQMKSNANYAQEVEFSQEAHEVNPQLFPQPPPNPHDLVKGAASKGGYTLGFGMNSKGKNTNSKGYGGYMMGGKSNMYNGTPLQNLDFGGNVRMGYSGNPNHQYSSESPS